MGEKKLEISDIDPFSKIVYDTISGKITIFMRNTLDQKLILLNIYLNNEGLHG